MREVIKAVVVATGAALVLSGCGFFVEHFTEYGKLERQARREYQSGDYDRAVFHCVRSLRIRPDYEKAQRLVQDAFRAAVREHLGRIERLKLSPDKFRWDDIVPEYEALIALNRAVESLPTLRVKETGEVIRFEIADYSRDLTDAKVKAAEAHYREGLKLSQEEGRKIKKRAAKHFKRALSFVPGYKDASEMYEKCRREAITRMAIVPFEDKSGKEGRYGAISETIADGVIAEIMGDPEATEFLELVSREELQRVLEEQKLQVSALVDERTAVEVGRLLGVHEILLGKITQILYVPPRTVRKPPVKRKARVVVRKEKYKDEKGVEHTKDVYGDVYATVIPYFKRSEASIIGSYKIVEVKTAKIKKSSSFEGKAEFECRWAKYSGDERALESEDKKLISKGEQLAPTEEEMVLRAARNLISSLAEDLKAYVR